MPSLVPACTYLSAASATAFLSVSCDMSILLPDYEEDDTHLVMQSHDGRPLGSVPAKLLLYLDANEIPRKNPEGARGRRRVRNTARRDARPVRAPRQPRAVEARRSAAGVLLQAARRLKEDRPLERRAARQGRDRRL